MFELKDKVIIVTGATSGIGREAALMLAGQGAKVVVAGRRETEGRAVVDAIVAAGGVATFVKADVTSESEMEGLFEKTISTYGKLDSVFLNAGIFAFSPIVDQTLKSLQSQIDVNVKGAYIGVKLGAKHLSKGGSITINSSGVAVKGIPNATAYSLTKGAINTLVKGAAVELAGNGIRVNAVAPGPIWTEGAETMMGSRENFEGAMAGLVPMKRVGEVAEIAAAVVFLASDEASFITGQILGVDGGASAN